MSKRKQIRDLIGLTFEEMGGKATIEQLRDQVALMLPEELNDYLAWGGLTSQIGAYFRQQQDGLPQAPEVDEHGTHVQLDLLSVEEYRYVVTKYVRNGKANFSKARRAADRCLEVYSVAIDIDDIEVAS